MQGADAPVALPAVVRFYRDRYAAAYAVARGLDLLRGLVVACAAVGVLVAMSVGGLMALFGLSLVVEGGFERLSGYSMVATSGLIEVMALGAAGVAYLFGEGLRAFAAMLRVGVDIAVSVAPGLTEDERGALIRGFEGAPSARPMAPPRSTEQ